MPELVDPRIQILDRLFNQCKQLKIPFPFDYKHLLNSLQEVDVNEFNKIVNQNLTLARARFKGIANRSSKILNHRRRKEELDNSVTKAKRSLKTHKHHNNRKQKKNNKAKETVKFKRPWTRIVLVGIMWRG
jgi:hypothetical protein